MNILIVEDEVRLTDALAQIMKEQKYQADIAYQGNAGLYYGLTGSYDVIIPDMFWRTPPLS